MNKLGFYIQKPDVEGIFDAMRVVRPPTMVVQAVNRGWLEDTRRFSPETFIVGRLFLNPDEQDQLLSTEDPEQPGKKWWLDGIAAKTQGRQFAEQILALDHPLALATWPYDRSLDDPDSRLLVDAWMTLNEFVPGPASDAYRSDPQDIQAKATAYDYFQVGFRERLKEAHQRLEAVAFNFAAGNFPRPQGYLDWFPRTLRSYVYLGFHEYGWPTLYPDPASVTAAGDYQRCMTGIRAKYGVRHTVIITEAGLARMHQKKEGGDVGWLYEGEPISQEAYWASLKWYNDQLTQDAYVLGACLYNVGYADDWRTFRHTGADDQGQPIRIMDRITALREEPEAPQHTAEPGSVTLKGRIMANMARVPGAKVRLLSQIEGLGADPRAASYDPGAIAWTLRRTDLAGSVWNCWQQLVAPQVAGITWEEFQVLVMQYNPSMKRSHNDFKYGELYLLPELKHFDAEYHIKPEIKWDRSIMGFAGDRWACWQRYVRTKVAGLTWEEFQEQVGARNPHLVTDGFRFSPVKTYLMPRDPDQKQYTRVAFAASTGHYRFSALPPGRYELEVTADGCQPLRRAVQVWADMTLDLELERFPVLPELEALPEVPDLANVLVSVRGTDFLRNGSPFQFVGVNLRGLAHYGTPQYPSASVKDQLEQVRAMGARVVRIFLPHKDVSTLDVKARLEGLLATLRTQFPEIYLIVALTDLYIDSKHFPKGDDEFYLARTDPDGRTWTLLRQGWFAGGYKKNYLPFVETIVGFFNSRPRILAWDIGNELKLPEAKPIFIDFNLAVAQRIRQLDSNHLITTGMMSTRHAGLMSPGQHKLYESPNIDFLTSHIYDAEYGDDDSALAADLKKPFLVEEAGFSAGHGENRTERVQQDMEIMFGRGARGYLQWGFMAGGNNGDGDDSRGMDTQFHGDWQPLFKTYSDRADKLRAI